MMGEIVIRKDGSEIKHFHMYLPTRKQLNIGQNNILESDYNSFFTVISFFSEKAASRAIYNLVFYRKCYFI